MKPRILITLMITAILLMLTASGLVRRHSLSAIRSVPIHGVTLSSVSDGTYRGEFRYRHFTYRTDVTVESHRITQVVLMRNRKTRYARKAEAVVKRVLEEQRLDVDEISGATISSRALLKAIDNAFSDSH